jgi:membrane-bound lytic murein transglycosylase MltF
MNLNEKQYETLRNIQKAARLLGVDPDWAAAVAMTESALGLHQLSRTGAKGVFQMTSIAMKDLLQEMQKADDDMIDIACGVLFLRLLFKRHKSIEAATAKYCDPNDRGFYIDRVKKYMKELSGISG